VTRDLVDLVNNLFTWGFAAGFLVGFCIERAWRWADTWWLNRHARDGKRYRVGGINSKWVAGTIVVFVVGLVMVETQRNSNCIDEFKVTLVKRSAITAENDRLSIEQRELLADNQRAEAEWINSLLRPPRKIDELAPGDPVREAWAVAISEDYFDHADKVNAWIKAISDEQRRNDEERARNPAPRSPM
jgi:hypothetical protein